MFTCHVCGAQEAYQELVDETFRINGKLVLVEKIPAQVCSRCGEVIFSSETAEKVRVLVQGQTEPTNTIQVDVSLINRLLAQIGLMSRDVPAERLY